MRLGGLGNAIPIRFAVAHAEQLTEIQGATTTDVATPVNNGCTATGGNTSSTIPWVFDTEKVQPGSWRSFSGTADAFYESGSTLIFSPSTQFSPTNTILATGIATFGEGSGFMIESVISLPFRLFCRGCGDGRLSMPE